MKITIIIPVYNVSRYIARCLNSVVSQDYHGQIECIIVNDCTPDDSMAKVSAIISQYHGKIDFKIIEHEINKGLSGARNTGIRNATGDYVYFLDSDDEITPGCISSLAYVAEKHTGVDIVQGNIVVTDEKYRYLELSRYNFPKFSSDSAWIHHHMLTDIPATSWNKLIRKSFLICNQLWFKEGIIHEDEHWKFMSAHLIQNIAFCDTPTYIYYRNPGSITETPYKDRSLLSWLEIYSDYLTLVKGDKDYHSIFSQLSYLTLGTHPFKDAGKMEAAYQCFLHRMSRSTALPFFARIGFGYARRPSRAVRIFTRLFLRRAYRLIKHIGHLTATQSNK